MRYFTEPEDEFAVVGHPWQPMAQHLHVLAAPLFVFACGLIWYGHVFSRLRSGFRPRHRSGLALALLLFPMIASGYLVQVSTGELWRTAWIWIHGLTGCAFVLAYLVHQLSPAKAG